MDWLRELKYNSHGLIPAITQDVETKEVLMMAYMNQEALEKTIETGKVHYYSRSREKLWLKGETSGHFQMVKEISYDCDGDTLLIQVEQMGGACHTGHKSCFYRTAEGVKETAEQVFDPGQVYGNENILRQVYEIIEDRRRNPQEGSYTNYLFTKGIDKMLKKVGEETAEVIIASKNLDKAEITYEISDLLYHLMVVMVQTGITWEDIFDELKGRR